MMHRHGDNLMCDVELDLPFAFLILTHSLPERPLCQCLPPPSNCALLRPATQRAASASPNALPPNPANQTPHPRTTPPLLCHCPTLPHCTLPHPTSPTHPTPPHPPVAAAALPDAPLPSSSPSPPHPPHPPPPPLPHPPVVAAALHHPVLALRGVAVRSLLVPGELGVQLRLFHHAWTRGTCNREVQQQ